MKVHAYSLFKGFYFDATKSGNIGFSPAEMYLTPVALSGYDKIGI